MQNRNYTASGVVTKGCGYLTDAHLSASASGAYVVVYDGVNDKGTVIHKGYAGDNLHSDFSPRTWPKYEVGLYVVISGTNASVNIGFRVDDGRYRTQ